MKPEGKFELLTFAGASALAQRAAAEWLQNVSTSAASGDAYSVALSGGRIARWFFSAVADRAKLARSALNSVHFFWGDERCVLPTDLESNFGLARRFLLQPLGIPESQVHRVRGEDPPELAAAQAEAELRRFAHPDPSGQPQLDMIFLGMGEDGHVASLFPGEPEELITSEAVFRPVVGSKPPPHRVTIGYPAIAAAREVWVLASGPGKEHALRESLMPDGGTPLGNVLRLRPHTRVFTDIQWNPDGA